MKGPMSCAKVHGGMSEAFGRAWLDMYGMDAEVTDAWWERSGQPCKRVCSSCFPFG